MSEDITALMLVSGTLVAGFVWGRLSSLLPIPEVVRLLATPVWTGFLSLIACSIYALSQSEIRLRFSAWIAELGLMTVARMAVGQSLLCFIAGAAFGLPAVLGWVVGYRRPRDSAGKSS